MMGFATDYKKYWDTGPLIFLKMPKCASTSVREATGAELVHHTPDDKPMFTVVRNPYTRVLSAWAHRINGSEVAFKNSWASEWGFWADKVRPGMAFGEMVDLICELPDEQCECHFCPTSYIANQCLPPEYIWFKLENLSQKWTAFALRFGFETRLPRKVSNPHPACSEVYTDELQAKVYERYESDFKRWEYGRGLPQ